MRKTVSLVLTIGLLLSQSNVSYVYATDNSTNTKTTNSTTTEVKDTSSIVEKYKAASPLFGATYTEIKKAAPRMVNSSQEEREEVILDRVGLASVTSLAAQTDANFEVLLSYPDKNTFFATSDTLDGAISIAKQLRSSNSVGADVVPAVLEKSTGQIVYATESMGRVVKVINGELYYGTDKNTIIYGNSGLTQNVTYMNSGYIDDVPILEDNGKAAKIEVAGYTGWVNKDTQKVNTATNQKEYDLVVVPVNKVTNPSYYKAEYGELKHYISSNMVSSTSDGYTIKMGPSPSFMKDGVKYYSYDGVYFYTSLKTLVTDAKANNHNNSVNASNPYYNYYQNLPFRSKSVYTAEQLNKYLETSSNIPFTSKLKGTGQALVDAQNNYGVNALMALGVAINESAWGNSTIAQQKNNLFGLNAVDSQPGQAANSFATVTDCINDFAKNWISNGYAEPDDWRYSGSNVGNKNIGVNVNYASDPYWGEKAAQYMYRVDYYISNFIVGNYGSNDSTDNLKEFNAYKLGMYTKANEVTSAPKSGSQRFYLVSENRIPGNGRVGNTFVIKNANIYKDGTTGYYNIQPDRPTVGYNYGGSFVGPYDWSKEAFVKQDGVKLISGGGSFVETKRGWVEEGGKWYYYDLTTGQKKIGFHEVEGKKYYFDETGARQGGWKLMNNNWYYFDTASGVMKTGWLYYGTVWYYLNGDGTMKTGWLYDGSAWYYLNPSGAMATGWLYNGGAWYYLHSSGAMAVGWVQLGSTWYYLNGSGAMVTGTVNIGGRTYRFASSGAWIG